MKTNSAEKKQALIEELEESDTDGLRNVLELLDEYTVTPPSPGATDRMVDALMPVLQEQASAKTASAVAEKRPDMPALLHLRLAISQTRLFSVPFICLSILLLVCGMGLTAVLNGEMVYFLSNAAPLLGVLTILYQFRAEYNHMDELESACPYTPAQMASARLLVVLGYDILLCLAVTPFIGQPEYSSWQVIIHWLAPLLLTLGIALIGSIPLGLWGGCLMSTAVWVANMMESKDDKGILAALLPAMPVMYIDLTCIVLGLALLAVSIGHLSHSGTRS